MIPNMQSQVDKTKAANPEAWKNMHTGNDHTEDFVRLLAVRLHALDSNFGLNGKRGNPNDISDDCVNYLCAEVESEGRTPDGKPCVVIDFGVGAGGSNATTGWNVMNTKVEGSGAWVKPGPVAPPGTPAIIEQGEFFKRFGEVNDFYAAKEGLQRKGGMVIDRNGVPTCDNEAMGQWGYQLMLGVTVESIKSQIRKIPGGEWQMKHPGETPS